MSPLIETPGSLPNVPDPATRPTEYVAVLVLAAFGIPLALGAAIPAAVPIAVSTFAVVVTTGVVSWLRKRNARKNR